MRQVVLVIVLVAAAFAGGAMVRGPGPRWIQSQLLDYMGLKDGGEVASIDLPAVSPSDSVHDSTPPPSGNTGNAPDRGRKTAEPLVSGAGQKGANSKTADASLRKTSSGETNGPKGQPASQSTGSPSPGLARSGPAAPAIDHAVAQSGASTSASRLHDLATTPADKAPMPLDPSVGSALLAKVASIAAPANDHDAINSIPLEAAPRSAPSAPTGQTPPLVPPQSAAQEDSSAATGAKEWSSLRRKMQVLGVTEYTIRGSPSGRVRIVCLIPFGARQGISQRFEAEGSNEFEATRSAIRKITLWQASRDRAP